MKECKVQEKKNDEEEEIEMVGSLKFDLIIIVFGNIFCLWITYSVYKKIEIYGLHLLLPILSSTT